MEEKKNNEDKKDQPRLSKSFIEEVKSFANTEGKQMVGFMRNKFREAMDEEEKSEPKDVDKKESLIVLPENLRDALKTASKATGKTVVELIHECVTRSLEDVIREDDSKKSEALSKLKLLKKEEG